MPYNLVKDPQAKLDGQAESFLQKHLNGSVWTKKSKSKKAALETAKLKLEQSLSQLAEHLDLLAYVKSSETDYKFIEALRGNRNKAVAPLMIVEKSFSGTTVKVEKAALDIAALSREAENFIARQKNSGIRDLSLQAEIKQAKAFAHAKRLEASTAFNAEANFQNAKILAIDPKSSIVMPAVAVFNEVIDLLRKEIDAISDSDPALVLGSVQSNLEGIMQRIETLKREQIQALKNFAEDPGFNNFMLNASMKAKVVETLDEAEPWVEKAIRWQTPSDSIFKAEMKRLRDDAAILFDATGPISSDEMLVLEQKQSVLLTAATKLRNASGREVNTMMNDFTRRQAISLQQVMALETRMKSLGGILGRSGQLKLVDEFVATARMAIDGLNGYSLSALDTADKLIAEAASMVISAEDLPRINKEITANIDAAKDACKSHAKNVKNPLAAQFPVFLTEVEDFESGFKGKIPNDAKKESVALLKKVNDKVALNDAIIKRRAEVQSIIDNVENDLNGLNDLFKTIFAHDPDMKGLQENGYGGQFKKDLETCKNWNASKTTLEFYDTIVLRLGTLSGDIMTNIAWMAEASKKPYQEIMLEAHNAKGQYDNEIKRLEEEAKANNSKIDGAAVIKAKAERDAKIDQVAVLSEMRAEFLQAGQEDDKNLEQILKFMAESKIFMTEIEVLQNKEPKTSPINTYGSEVKRHMETLKTSRDLLKNLTTVEKVKKDGKDAPTGAAALSELVFVKQMVQRIWDRGEKTSKSDLGKIKTQWEQEVLKFDQVQSALMNAIDSFERQQEIGDGASSKLNPILNRILSEIRSHNFARPADVLAVSEDPAQRKAAREQALAEVRRIRKVMFDDPIFKKCVMNPFKIGDFGSSNQYRLEEIELNVLRGS